MDESAREAVATSYAVDDGHDVVALALIELLAVIDECLPSVVGGRQRLAECGHNILEPKGFHHAAEDAIVTLCVCLAPFHICFGFESQAELRVFFIAYADVHIFHQWLHDALCFLACP